MGLYKELRLGNLDSYRDWGHSKDYVRAMQLMLTLESAGDYVVSTGETRSIRDLCDLVFRILDLNYEDFVVQDPKYLRPEELPYLCGDSAKFRNVSGWSPRITFEQMISEMISEWSNRMKI
jgi:GDPmannose 4,6-dehydratase